MLQQTEHINRKTVQNIMRAFDYAAGLLVPLNVSVVINLADTDDKAAAQRFTHIRDKYRDWLHRHSRKRSARMPPMYVFACENPGGAHPHVNWVLRVPVHLLDEFERKLPGWVAKAQPARDFDIEIQRLAPDGPYKSLANYICKGCDPAFIDHFHLRALTDEHGPQGTYFGKRAGVCPAFNKAAREAAGWDDKRRRFRPNKTDTVPPASNRKQVA